MGQWTIGIMYGVEVPKGLNLHGEDDNGATEEDGLLDQCKTAFGGQIAKNNKSRPNRQNWEDARDLYVPSWAHEDKCLLGFWVAVGASGEWEAESLERSCRLDTITATEPYATAHKNAVDRWDRFAAWAKKAGFVIPDAQLWITPVEVA